MLEVTNCLGHGRVLRDYGHLSLLAGTFLEGESAILFAASLVHAGFFEAPQTVLFAFFEHLRLALLPRASD